MPYQTGTFTSASDLRTTLEAFATTNGWTQSGNLLHKGSVYVEVYDSTNGVSVTAGLGKDGGNNLTTPASLSRGVYMLTAIGQTMSFPGTYHLISLANPDSIFLVVNYNVTYWQHLAFGHINKHGTWGGGEYASGSFRGTASGAVSGCPAGDVGRRLTATGAGALGGFGYMLSTAPTFSHATQNGSADLYCDLDGEGWRINTADYSTLGSSRFYASAIASQYLQTINSWNDQTVLAPVIVEASRTGNFVSILGDMPHVRYLRIDNINDGEVISVGSQDWICFPFIRKNPFVIDSTNAVYNHSYYMGWCIKYDGP